MTKVGTLILERRKQLNKTQIQLSLDLNITPQFLGHIEKGRVKFPIRRTASLCRSLGISAETVQEAFIQDFKSGLRNVLKSGTPMLKITT